MLARTCLLGLTMLSAFLLASVGGCSVSTVSDDNTGTQVANSVAEEIHSTSMVERIVTEAKEDLAHRLDLLAEDIELQSVEVVNWSDKTYGQIVTSGYIIKLEVGECQYEYRADEDGTVVLWDSILLSETMTKTSDTTVKDGGPNETRENDVVIEAPSERK